MAPGSQNIDEIMESKNPFCLADAIRDWRAQFQSGDSVAVYDLDELESHLRDSCEELVELGLNEEEAFLVSRKRMGSPASLGSEFGKLYPSRQWSVRVCWMLVGFLSFHLVGDLAGVLSKVGGMGASMLGLGATWANALGVLLLLLPWLAFAGFLFRRCQGGFGGQGVPFSWLLRQKPAISMALVVGAFVGLFVLGQAITILFYRTQTPIDGTMLSSYHTTQAVAGLGLSCCLMAGGTLAVLRLRRRILSGG